MDQLKFEEDLKSGCKIACWGSREAPAHILALMTGLGAKFAKLGAGVASGHCQGADLAWERGVCSVAPEKFLACLPWKSYNKEIPVHPKSAVACLADMSQAKQKTYFEIAKAHHPVWDRLSNGARLLHGRNILIGENSSYGFTYLNHSKPGGGGSGQCARYLKSLGMPVIDLALPEQHNFWVGWMSK